MEWKGIDVSQWQGSSIDFKKVKAAGIKFVIIRAGFGKYTAQKDPCFETNYSKAKAAGLNVGVYWYSYATSIDDARLEAKACLDIIKGKTFEMPIYFDLEERAQFVKGKTFCSELVKTFCGELEKAGYWAGLYISRSPLQSYITPEVAKRYALWVAEYASKLNYSGTVGMWQYTSTGKVDGIGGNVDMNKCFVDYPAEIKAAGMNGFEKKDSKPKKESKPKPEPEKKPAKTKYTTYTVKKGDTLLMIAAKYNTTVAAIVKMNNIKNPDLIITGQKLKIPTA